MLSWNELIALAHERRASDVHMVCGLPFLCRVDGRVERLTDEPLTRAQCEQYAQQLAGEEYEALREIGERDLSCSFECGVRVRVNLFCQQDAVSAAVRLLAEMCIRDRTSSTVTDVIVWHIEQSGTDTFSATYEVDQQIKEGEQTRNVKATYTVKVHVDADGDTS